MRKTRTRGASSDERRNKNKIDCQVHRLAINLHIVVSIIVSFFLTGSWDIAVAIGTIYNVITMVRYYFHERLWNKIMGNNTWQENQRQKPGRLWFEPHEK